MVRLGGLRGFLSAVLAVALVAPALDTAWTSRTPSVVSLVDPSLRAGEVALVHTTGGHAGALSNSLSLLGAIDIETDEAADVVVARLSPAALDAVRTDARVTLATRDVPITASGTTWDRKLVFEKPKLIEANTTLNALRAPSAWWRTTGAGVTVAVMDTGIADHPDLAGKVTARMNFVNDGNTQLDPGGHGTFLAGLIAANGGMTGVAPSAKLVSLRVLDANGNGMMSSVVKAFDWLLRNGKSYGVKVLSISWGSPQSTSYHRNLMSALVEAAWFSDVTVVAAAGNGGPNAGTVTVPATDPFVIAVGSYNDMGTLSFSDDTLSAFSGRGPTLEGFAKPDTLAPGEHVSSLRVSGLSYLDASGLPVGLATDRYVFMSGTSASAAYIAGVAALLRAARPTARSNDIKGAILASGRAVLGTTTTAADATSALFKTASANAGLLPSRTLLKILARAHQLTVSGVSWEGVSWDGVTWDGVSWEAVSWETISWETVAWETVAWETVTWEGVAWEDAVITE